MVKILMPKAFRPIGVYQIVAAQHSNLPLFHHSATLWDASDLGNCMFSVDTQTLTPGAVFLTATAAMPYR